MTITTTSPDNDPCSCHLVEYTSTDTLCPACEERREREREAKREARKQHDDEYAAENAAFIDAASRMSPEDWDADNDWLASAGWGEM